jgi:hypothetical protein
MSDSEILLLLLCGCVVVGGALHLTIRHLYNCAIIDLAEVEKQEQKKHPLYVIFHCHACNTTTNKECEHPDLVQYCPNCGAPVPEA